jgi:diguanylate cyclase (GGDEF)-like protein
MDIDEIIELPLYEYEGGYVQEFLDLRTLSVNNILVSLSFGICLVMYSRHYPQFKGINTLGYSFIVSSCGFLLIGFRGYIPDFFSIIIPNVLLVFSMTLVHLGFSSFYEFNKVAIKQFHFVLLTSIFISAMGFTYLDNNTNVRIVIISLILSIQCVYIMRTLLMAYQNNQHKANLMIAISFLIFATFFAFRALITISEKPLIDFMNAGLLHSLSIIVYQFVVIITSFSLVWMVSHKIHKILRDQATHDPLTKVFNRRALEEVINVESARSLRNQSPLAVVMLDIDFFKRLNDRYGHSAGDQVLVTIAGLLVENTRGYDSIARFGGEEFIILLPSTDADKGRGIAEKLREKIENHEYHIKDNRSVNITASFGVTSCELSKESWLTVLDRCDRALYLAKESGRNKVIVFKDDNQDADKASAG